jgi:hypothetical protein
VGSIGPGLSERIEDVGDMQRHTVTLTPQPYSPEEDRAVSPIDRDPALLMSTFHSYEDIGRAYAAAAAAKVIVTPEITALAEGDHERRERSQTASGGNRCLDEAEHPLRRDLSRGRPCRSQ